MNQTWSPFPPDNVLAPSSASLEMPFLLRSGHQNEKTDTMSPAPRFSVSPFDHSSGEERLSPLAGQPSQPLEPDLETERRIRSLRRSPGFTLIAESVLLLKACQLDMDLPPSRRNFIRERLATVIQELSGRPLDPDQLYLTFTTVDHPSVDEDGTERHNLRLSLTDVAQLSFDPWRFSGLQRCAIVETPLTTDAPSLSAPKLFAHIRNAAWPNDYHAVLTGFWARHRSTYRSLCKLGFVDGLARQLARKQISLDGYLLTLDALGLRKFPHSLSALEHHGRGQKTEVRGLSLDGEPIPGIFQIRSKNTSHCFIHVVGTRGQTIEYISDDPKEMTRRMLDALNNSAWHRRLLHMAEQTDRSGMVVESSLIKGDVFTALTRAQEDAAIELTGAEDYDRFNLLKPIARALALASATELWQAHSPVLELIPEPSKIAAQLMSAYLHRLHGLSLNPDHVFIAYRRGHATTPLGDARVPAHYVNVPDDTPVSLSQALMSNYRIQFPAGYIDHGGRTLVFFDDTGKGVWAPEQVLPINPQHVEDYIKDLDFLAIMSDRINDFWNTHKLIIEQAFSTVFIAEALIALKQNRLGRGGFDLVVKSLTEPDAVSCSALGFHVKSSVLESMEIQYAGLVLLEQTGRLKVLYQAGHVQAFREFRSDDELRHYLRSAAADAGWRNSVMHYVPGRHRDRLDYLLKLWGGVQAPTPPASLLRPWTDGLYNPDTRKALEHSLVERKLDGLPFGFMREALRQNALKDTQDRIVTGAEVSLRYWMSLLNRLQLLLVPMSVLLTPAFMASLATEIGVASLNLVSAHLPGSRKTEKIQSLLTTLSLGLLRIGPKTPALLRSLSRIVKPAGTTARAGIAAGSGLGSLFRRSIQPRKTRLEKFFHTDAMLKRWTIPGHPRFGAVPVHAWKMGRRFLLWTSDRGQARTLVVSTHGHYLPWSSTVRIPHGTEIQTYAPHGFILVDPMLHRIVNKTVQPFAVSNVSGNTLVQTQSALPSLLRTDKMMAGTSLPGRLKNYTLSKYQSVRHETYEDIGHIVRNSNASPLRGQLPATPMDVLTVRNRFGVPSPTLADLFDTLYAQGIHYDRILLVHCRCAAIAARLGRAPIYQAPILKPPIRHDQSEP
jgi:hypothetical protein